MWGPKQNLGPIGSSIFIGYKQTNKQTNKLTYKRQAKYIDRNEWKAFLDRLVVSSLFKCSVLVFRRLLMFTLKLVPKLPSYPIINTYTTPPLSITSFSLIYVPSTYLIQIKCKADVLNSEKNLLVNRCRGWLRVLKRSVLG